MLAILHLLLPALIPSWRFFDTVRPSPRIEFCLLDSGDRREPQWRAFQSPPQHLPVAVMLRRLLWNPEWNQFLYSVSCTERLLDEPSLPRENALLRRVAQAIPENEFAQAKWFRVRIVVLKRQGDRVDREVMYMSAAQPLAAHDA